MTYENSVMVWVFVIFLATTVLIKCLCTCIHSVVYKKMKNRRRPLFLAPNGHYYHDHHDYLYWQNYQQNDVTSASQPLIFTLTSDSRRRDSSSSSGWAGGNHNHAATTTSTNNHTHTRRDSSGFYLVEGNNSRPPSRLSMDSGHVFDHFHAFSTTTPGGTDVDMDTDTVRVTVTEPSDELTQVVIEGEQPLPPYENFQPPTYEETVSSSFDIVPSHLE